MRQTAGGGEAAPSGGGAWLLRLIRVQEVGLVAVIVLMVAGLWLFSGTTSVRDRETGETVEINRFLNPDNLIQVATSASFIAIMAVGATAVIVSGGIDLSVGSIYALAAIAGAAALRWVSASWGDTGPPMPVAVGVGVGACCLVGAVCGAVNGAASVLLRVHPFIITLGGMAVYRGLAFVTTNGEPLGDFPAAYTTGAFRAEALGVNPVPLVLMLGVAAAGAWLFGWTVPGRWMYAIGGNETAARYAGVPVDRMKVALFAGGGLLAGLSAAQLLGYYGAASSADGQGYELKVIAASVVGGASLNGGRGSAVGAMLGAVVIQLIDNGIVCLKIDSNYTNIVIGLAIVLAVVVEQLKDRLLAGAR